MSESDSDEVEPAMRALKVITAFSVLAHVAAAAAFFWHRPAT
jgi:hypothetical protein